jgi:hypothetical protein
MGGTQGLFFLPSYLFSAEILLLCSRTLRHRRNRLCTQSKAVLSGGRSATPSPTLNENLTQIITIVLSIVAVCKDNLPPGSATQGADILRELGEYANRLSELQALLPDVNKESTMGAIPTFIFQ